MVPEVIPHHRFRIPIDGAGDYLEAAWWGPGPQRAPTLIFLHEGLGCVDLWKDFPANVAAITGWGALAYSRLGYGGSSPCLLPRPLDFMQQEALVVLPRVIAQTGIRDYLLIGHSDGGSIALVHAGEHSNSGLTGVVTMAAHVFCEDLTRQSIRAARERYLSGDLKERLAVYHGSNTRCAFKGWSDVWLHPEFASWSIDALLPGITVPVLAIQGENDPYGSSLQIDGIVAGAGDAVTVEMIGDCGHAPHHEKKEVVLPAIVAFVSERLGAPGR